MNDAYEAQQKREQADRDARTTQHLITQASTWLGWVLIVGIVVSGFVAIVFRASACSENEVRVIHCAEFWNKPTPPECR